MHGEHPTSGLLSVLNIYRLLRCKPKGQSGLHPKKNPAFLLRGLSFLF
jgi:hypothetical protein